MPAARDPGKGKAKPKGKAKRPLRGFTETPLAPPNALPPARVSPVGDRPADRGRDLKRAEKFKRSKAGRKATRDTYIEQPLATRRRTVRATKGKGGATADVVKGTHGARMRAKRAVDAFEAWQKKHPTLDGAPVEVLKGARVTSRQLNRLVREVNEGEDRRLADELSRAPKLGKEPSKPIVKEAGPGGIMGLLGDIAGGFAGAQAARSKGDSEATTESVRERVERSTGTPAVFTFKGTKDGMTKLLDQLNRPASASAGAAIKLAEGGDLGDAAKGAAEGFVKNDKSYRQVAEKAGLHGIAADVVGLTGDIFLDVTTYLSGGLSAPAKARQAEKLRRLSKRYGRQFNKVAKASGGDIKAARDTAEWKAIADRMAADRAKIIKDAARLEGEVRGIQAGVRLPGGRQVRTSGRATAAVAKKVGTSKLARKGQQGKLTNEALRKFSPNQRPRGWDDTDSAGGRAGFEDAKGIEREAEGLRQLILRKGVNAARLLKATVGKDRDQLADIVDAIEAGKVDQLPRKLRRAAQATERFYDDVSSEWLALTGKELKLWDTILPLAEVDDTVKLAREVTEQAGKRAARTPVRSVKREEQAVADAIEELNVAQGRAEVLSRNVNGRAGEDAAQRAGRGAGESQAGRLTDDEAKLIRETLERVERDAADRRTLLARIRDEGADSPRRRLIATIEDDIKALDAKAAQFRRRLDGHAEGARQPGYAGGGKGVEDALRALDEATARLNAAMSRAEAPRADRVAKAEQMAARLEDAGRAPTKAEEEELVANLRAIVSDLEDEAVGRAVNDYLGLVRKGRVNNPELRAALDDPSPSARALVSGERKRIAALAYGVGAKLGPKEERLRQRVASLADRLQYETPVGYTPHARADHLADRLDGATDSSIASRTSGRVDGEYSRQDRRRMEALRAENPDAYSPDVDLLVALGGVDWGHRVSNLAYFRAMRDRFGRAAAPSMRAEPGMVMYRVDDVGAMTRVPAKLEGETVAELEAMERAAADAGALPDYNVYVFPEAVGNLMDEVVGVNATRMGSDWLDNYDKFLRGWKSLNTILRPGFFATTLLGNFWQQYLLDTSIRDMARSMAYIGALRAERSQAVRSKGMSGKVWGHLLDQTTKKIGRLQMPVVLHDGSVKTLAELIEEGTRAGAVRTGSRINDAMELRPATDAQRKMAGRASMAHTIEFLGELSEDLDDMTRLILYMRARRAGADVRAATAYTYTGMIDYSDLTEFERRVMKRVMPFYIYTMRNLGIQVRRNLARPGKLANLNKVREFFAETAGLPDDWETLLPEGDQERMPFPVPGAKRSGFQMYRYLRLPVEDLAAPAQLLQRDPGRMGERYLSGIFGPLKAFYEVPFNQRLDYDRPIDVPGKPPEAGKIMRLLGELGVPGATIGQHSKKGRTFEGTNPYLDYILRTATGSYGAAGLGWGKTLPDNSNIPWDERSVSSVLLGQGTNAPDPAFAAMIAKLGEKDKNAAAMNRLEGRGKGNSVEWYDEDEKKRKLNNALLKLRAIQGDLDAQRRLREVARQETRDALRPRTSEDRYWQHRLDVLTGKAE